jgi:hypothetical protein|nr:MAG TPA: Putative helicase [Caudoviricetes sp.]
MEDMKEKFLSIYTSKIARPGADKLLEWLKKSDFFNAPASTRYHLSEPGGLVTHSIHVYERLRDLYIAEKYREVKKNGADRAASTCELSDQEEETLAICGLLHDACKINFYVPGTRNVKNEKTGQWEKVPCYTIDDQLPYGHGEKSVYIISGFMRLSREEAMAIRWHMGGFGENNTQNVSGAFSKYPLAVLTHLADMQATYLDENES